MKYKSPTYREPLNPVGTVAELFAGVGGFRLGLSQAGWKTIYSNQWEPSTKQQHASDCYIRNFGEEGHSNLDISLVKSVPTTDLIVGGFPCQDYSVAKSLNSSKGLQGKKGVLWWEIHRIVQANRPKFVFLENVDRLLKSPSSQRGRDFAIMLKTLGDLGYLVEWRVVNAAEYGFPQRRIRVFIVATRLSNRKALSGAEAENLMFAEGIVARALAIHPLTNSVSEIDLGAAPEVLSHEFGLGLLRSPFLTSGVYFKGRCFTSATVASGPKKRKVLGDILVQDSEVPDEYWISSDRLAEWEYLKGAKSVQRIHKGSGTKYQYSEGKMAFPDLLENPSRTILTGEGGNSASRFKHIIQIGERYRRLTPVELERLNGFPDGWTEYGRDDQKIPDSRRAFFMGNALVVGLIEKVGQVLAQEMNSTG